MRYTVALVAVMVMVGFVCGNVRGSDYPENYPSSEPYVEPEPIVYPSPAISPLEPINPIHPEEGWMYSSPIEPEPAYCSRCGAEIPAGFGDLCLSCLAEEISEMADEQLEYLSPVESEPTIEPDDPCDCYSSAVCQDENGNIFDCHLDMNNDNICDRCGVQFWYY